MLAAAVSLVAFALLGIQEGDLLQDLRKLFPSVATSSPWLTFPLACLFGIAHAVSEELIYRGGMLAFVFRKCKDRAVLRYLGIMAITLVWAIGHVPNTNAPVFKVIQIFIIGIIFAAMARRSSLRNAIAAHIGLNATCVVISYIWQMIY